MTGADDSSGAVSAFHVTKTLLSAVPQRLDTSARTFAAQQGSRVFGTSKAQVLYGPPSGAGAVQKLRVLSGGT